MIYVLPLPRWPVLEWNGKYETIKFKFTSSFKHEKSLVDPKNAKPDTTAALTAAYREAFKLSRTIYPTEILMYELLFIAWLECWHIKKSQQNDKET